MCCQQGDIFYFENENYDILALSKQLKFNPKRHKIKPKAFDSGCWAGYWCGYKITDEGLFLEDLYINAEGGWYPEIKKKKAVLVDESEPYFYGYHVYRGLHFKVRYTGKILVGTDILDDYVLRSIYQWLWTYGTVKELFFKKGKLIGVRDQSHVAKELRKKIEPGENLDCVCEKLFSKDMIEDMIGHKGFDLDYRSSAPWLIDK